MTITNMIPAPGQLLALYESVGWTVYHEDPARLIRGIANSLRVYSAWEDGQLIGLVRAVGDGETILYVQDLLVHPDFQGQGVGGELLDTLMDDFPAVHQKVLLTEMYSLAGTFAEQHDFVEADILDCQCYMRLDAPGT